jgi:PIN domain nuclease of toxin-antitoxin system
MTKVSGAIVSTVSLAEVFAALIAGGATTEESRSAIQSLPFEYVAFSTENALLAASYRSQPGLHHLPFENLAALALAKSLGLTMVTASDQLPPDISGVTVEIVRESSRT